MKKLLVLGLSAVVVALATGRPADAWINSKFSVGLNWQWQSANNCFLWGVYRNGEVPQNPGAYYMGPPPAVPGQPAFPWFGNAAPKSNAPTVSTGQMPYTSASYSGYGTDIYSPASYQPNYQQGYQPSYEPNYQQGYQSGYQPDSYYGTGYYNQPFSWYYPR
jgi:hypothetical protein